MSAIARMLRTVLALFVDDGSLALHVLLVLTGTAIVARYEGAGSWPAMTLLVAGTVVVLAQSVTRATGKR